MTSSVSCATTGTLRRMTAFAQKKNTGSAAPTHSTRPMFAMMTAALADLGAPHTPTSPAAVAGATGATLMLSALKRL